MTDAASGTVLERGARLSRSLLFRLQRRYFERQGIEAWRQGTVPHYITSNTFIARAYARVVLGFIRDCQARLHPGEPVHVVELGAGSGRFAYHFLKKLTALFERSAQRDVPVRYVLTDLAEQNVAYWLDHPSLQPFVEAGLLDFARFDVEQDREITLRRSGLTLSPGTLHNPLIVLANYVFDGIGQDAFAVLGGKLHESLCTVSLPGPTADLDDPAILDRLRVTWEHRPVSADYYEDPAYDRILRGYEQSLGDAGLLFPVAALGCLGRLRELSGDRLLLLSGDKGHHREAARLAPGEPVLAIHGSFSMMVNYNVIAEYVGAQGGVVLATDHAHAHLDVSGFLFGPDPTGHVETRHAFHEAIEVAGPDDFFTLKKILEKHFDTLSLPQIVAVVRMSGWDTKFFRGCLGALHERGGAASDAMKEELCRLVDEVWDNHYPIGEAYDLAFEIGSLLCRLDRPAEALAYFERSPALDPSISPAEAVRRAIAAAAAEEPRVALVERATALGHHFGKVRVARDRT